MMALLWRGGFATDQLLMAAGAESSRSNQASASSSAIISSI